jgi:hypothetical protein
MKVRAATLLTVLSVLGAEFFASGTARAQTVIFDNLNNGNNGYRGVSSTSWDAQRFNSDSTNLFLVSLTLNLSTQPGSGTAFLSLYSDAAGHPGAQIANLFTGVPGSGNVTFGNLSQPLSPNTNYWLVLGTNGGTLNLGWGVTSTLTGTGSGFQTTAASTSNSGTNWSVFGDAPYQTRITANTVPEPEAITTFAMGLAGLVLLRLWRVRRAAA